MEIRNITRQTYENVTLSATNPTRTALGLNPDLRGDSTRTNFYIQNHRLCIDIERNLSFFCRIHIELLRIHIITLSSVSYIMYQINICTEIDTRIRNSTNDPEFYSHLKTDG
jgi:hypothetical protein